MICNIQKPTVFNEEFKDFGDYFIFEVGHHIFNTSPEKPLNKDLLKLLNKYAYSFLIPEFESCLYYYVSITPIFIKNNCPFKSNKNCIIEREKPEICKLSVESLFLQDIKNDIVIEKLDFQEKIFFNNVYKFSNGITKIYVDSLIDGENDSLLQNHFKEIYEKTKNQEYYYFSTDMAFLIEKLINMNGLLKNSLFDFIKKQVKLIEQNFKLVNKIRLKINIGNYDDYKLKFQLDNYRKKFGDIL